MSQWPNNLIHLRPIDLALERVIERHLGADGSFIGTQYANRAVAVRFCEFSLAGASKFALNKRRNDLEHLAKLQNGIDQAQDAMLRISKQALLILDPPPKRDRFDPYASIPEEELEEYLASESSRLMEVSESSRLMEILVAKTDDSLKDILSRIQSRCDELKTEIERNGVDLRVDWTACAVANLATVAWENRRGKPAPKTIHADAPGPFGRFLSDVLEVIYEGYDLGAVPSARSAMRALMNVTNSGIKPVGNW
jgi:hypothetical protein